MDGLNGLFRKVRGSRKRPPEILWLFGKRDIELGIGGRVVQMYLDPRLEQ